MGLQRLPARKSGLEVMPPFELTALAGLPAKQHHATITHGRKIDQAALIVLQLHSHAFELVRAERKLREELRILRAHFRSAATMLSALRGFSGSSLKREQLTMRTLDRLHDPPHAGEQGIGFFDSKKLHLGFPGKRALHDKRARLSLTKLYSTDLMITALAG